MRVGSGDETRPSHCPVFYIVLQTVRTVQLVGTRVGYLVRTCSIYSHISLQPAYAVLGQLRTTVCQAQLLMRQKLKQYLGLVEGAAKEQEGRTTSAEDLQVGRKGMSFS